MFLLGRARSKPVGYSPFPPIRRRSSPRKNLGARTQTIFTLKKAPPFQGFRPYLSSRSPAAASATPSAIKKNCMGRHRNTSSTPASTSRMPASCLPPPHRHPLTRIPPFPAIVCKAAQECDKKGPCEVSFGGPFFHRSVNPFAESRRNHSMTLGKVFTSASDTHCVTAAS